jgi:hypothetical protein
LNDEQLEVLQRISKGKFAGKEILNEDDYIIGMLIFFCWVPHYFYSNFFIKLLYFFLKFFYGRFLTLVEWIFFEIFY